LRYIFGWSVDKEKIKTTIIMAYKFLNGEEEHDKEKEKERAKYPF
jgi:hypothetical protein